MKKNVKPKQVIWFFSNPEEWAKHIITASDELEAWQSLYCRLYGTAVYGGGHTEKVYSKTVLKDVGWSVKHTQMALKHRKEF